MRKLSSPWFSFKGIENEEMGVLMVNMPTRQVPALQGQKTTVPNRDGFLLVTDDTYGAITVKQDIVIKDTDDVSDALAWLSGSGQLVFFDEPDFYYEGSIINVSSMVSPSKRLGGRKLSVTWTCQPFKKMLGEKPVTLNVGDGNTLTFKGNGHVNALPVVTVFGSGDIVPITLNGVNMKLSLTQNQGLYIDCEAKIAYIYDAYGNMVYAGSKVVLEDGEWFRLNPNGEPNTLTISSGITGVSIQPNWRWF